MDDPILAQRARVRRIADGGKRAGYLLFAIAMVLFFASLVTGLDERLVLATTVSLIAGCVVLAPAILLGYAVKGADRDDAERHGLGRR